MKVRIAFLAFAYLLVLALGCEPDQYHNGCQIVGNTCKCGYGCKTEYIYKTRRACRNALKVLERTPNAGYGSGYERTNAPSAGYSPGYDKINPSAGYDRINQNTVYGGGYDRPNPVGYERPNPSAGYGTAYERTNPNVGYGPGYERTNPNAGYGSEYDRTNPNAGYNAGYDRPNSAGYSAGYERSNPDPYGAGLTQSIPLSPAPQRSSNVCSSTPCSRGICIQTTNEPGFTCKCEGTGYYGQRCEKACPTTPIRGMVFPHECVVI